MTPDYQKTLERLSALLRRRPMTVAQIAEAMKCSKPVAYDRLKALMGPLGYKVTEHEQPQAEPGLRNRGPRPLVYSLR